MLYISQFDLKKGNSKFSNVSSRRPAAFIDSAEALPFIQIVIFGTDKRESKAHAAMITDGKISSD
jgi:hypothetical protein